MIIAPEIIQLRELILDSNLDDQRQDFWAELLGAGEVSQAQLAELFAELESQLAKDADEIAVYERELVELRRSLQDLEANEKEFGKNASEAARLQFKDNLEEMRKSLKEIEAEFTSIAAESRTAEEQSQIDSLRKKLLG